MADYNGAHSGAEVDDGVGAAKGAGAGIMVKTGTGTGTRRTITGTTDQIDVANGDGVSGAPTLSLASAVTTSLGLADSALQSVTGTADEIDVAGGDTISLASAATASLALADTSLQPGDKTGSDAGVVSGTAGTAGNLGEWNGDGDLVDSGETVESVRNFVAVNAQTGTSYTLVLSDAGKLVTMANAGANTLTVPTNASVAFAVGTIVSVVQKGAGTTSVAGASGVTVNGVSAGSGDMSTQWQAVSLMKIGTDEWIVSGDIGTVA